MMLCVMARRYLAASAAGPAGPGLSDARQRALAHHLVSCPGCRSESERLGRLLTLLADAAPAPIRMDADLFHQRLMATIGTRRRRPAGAPTRGAEPTIPGLRGGEPSAWPGFRPATLLPALCLMLAAGVTALTLSGRVPPPDAARLAASPIGASADEYQDALGPPREVPFSVEEDLVGMRRGTIPLTTYVLEPAPRDAPVILASF